MLEEKIDVREENILNTDRVLLEILLSDKTTGENILWATDDYLEFGEEYSHEKQILPELITGEHAKLIQPRVEKSKSSQSSRTRDKAEVFTPSWICNKQNNLVDNAWFDSSDIFNIEHDKEWTATTEKIKFPTPSGKTWEDYIEDTRLEITCGEAPYLVSRYDAVTGKSIDISKRIGLLDRKLRIISENVDSEPEWYRWAKKAVQNTYGFEWQGDSILLARENLLFTFSDYYRNKFGFFPIKEYLREIAEIIAWNIWQMDGLKFVIPNSCTEVEERQLTLFEETVKKHPCEGCKKNDPFKHTGIYCYIFDWKANETVRFVDLLKKNGK